MLPCGVWQKVPYIVLLFSRSLWDLLALKCVDTMMRAKRTFIESCGVDIASKFAFMKCDAHTGSPARWSRRKQEKRHRGRGADVAPPVGGRQALVLLDMEWPGEPQPTTSGRLPKQSDAQAPLAVGKERGDAPP